MVFGLVDGLVFDDFFISCTLRFIIIGYSIQHDFKGKFGQFAVEPKLQVARKFHDCIKLRLFAKVAAMIARMSKKLILVGRASS